MLKSGLSSHSTGGLPLESEDESAREGALADLGVDGLVFGA